MLLPITSRLLLDAFRPERPCWKPMACSLSVEAGKDLVEGLDGAVGDRARALELEIEAGARRADRVDAVAHQRRHLGGDAAGRRGDPEGQAAAVRRRARGPVEAVHAGALGAEVERLHDGAARAEDLDLDRVGGAVELEAALADAGLG